MTQLGWTPTDYGCEPREGRKTISALINWATDATWFFDFTILEQQKIFSCVQTIVANFQLTAGNGFDVLVGPSQKIYSVSTANLSTSGLPFIIPIFDKEPTLITFVGRAGISGSSLLNFCNFPLIPAPKGLIH